jgi:hypothetical protein
MGFLMKGVLLYLLLAISIAFAAPHMIFSSGSPADNTVLSWFNVRIDSNDSIYYNTINYSSTGDAGPRVANLSTIPPLPTGTGFLAGIDPLLQVFSWVGTFGKMLFSPIVIFTNPEMSDAPIALLMLIGIPVVVLFILGIIIWIRNGES